MNVDLKAIFHGLKIDWSKGLKNIICESNSIMALKMIANGVPITHSLAAVINNIRTFMDKEWSLSLSNIL